MTNELTDVRCSCGDEYPADSYDAGFIAGSGMCQNCDAALPPKDICTCPSGDGSLRHPCPAHPESVELAGVAAKLTFINGRPAMCGCQVEYSSGGGEYSDVIYVTLCAKHSGSAILDLVATNRIALTPEYEGQWHADLYLDREIPLAKVEGATPAEAVLALMSAERIDPEQESVEQASGDERAAFRPAQVISYRPGVGEVTIYVAGRVPGYMNIGDTVYVSDRAPVEQPSAALAQPSPVLPPFAEKVLAKLRRFYDCASDFESGGVDIGRHWLDLLTQLGLLNRVQRSPALWEITQQGEDLLGTQQPSPAQAEHANSGYDQCRDDVARALGLRPSQERGFAWSYLLASIKSCVMASEDTAQAQHSVPEGYALIPTRETEAMHDAVMALLYKGVARTDTQKLLDAYIAAAPGKEGV